jgi:hypothetical protein
LYSRFGIKCFVVPPIVGILQLIALKAGQGHALEPSRRTGS